MYLLWGKTGPAHCFATESKEEMVSVYNAVVQCYTCEPSRIIREHPGNGALLRVRQNLPDVKIQKKKKKKYFFCQ